jgi:5-methylthioribose kinase
MVEPAESGMPLDGGVASDVRVVDTPDGPIVIKKALPKLKVDADWFSDPARSLVEVAAIQTFASISGKETVPEIIWTRPDEHCFAMGLVDPRLRNWKADLIAGRIDLATARRVGEVLGRVHSSSATRQDIARDFEDLRFFRELRVEPFFDFVAVQKPELAQQIARVAQDMLGRRSALVHGDYSPKNILADGSDVVILDFEVAHWGDPRFDLAFCLAHLMLKSTLRGGQPDAMGAAIRALLESYATTGLPVIDAALANITGCLLLARLFGKSPVDYRDRIDAESIETKAIALLGMDAIPDHSSFLISSEQQA